MVKLRGPILSLGGSGSIAKVLTVSNWKGRPYAKKFAIPTGNDKTTQTGVRAMMHFLSQQWSALTPTEQASWDALAEQHQISAFNAYIGSNLTRSVDSLSPTKETPPTAAAFMPSALAQSVTAAERYVAVHYSNALSPTPWGMKIYRSESSGYTPSIATLAIVAPPSFIPAIANLRDVPPRHATWYYRFETFDAEGNNRLHAGEQTAVF